METVSFRREELTWYYVSSRVFLELHALYFREMATRGRFNSINKCIGNHSRPEGGSAAQTLVFVVSRAGSDGAGASVTEAVLLR